MSQAFTIIAALFLAGIVWRLGERAADWIIWRCLTVDMWRPLNGPRRQRR